MSDQTLAFLQKNAGRPCFVNLWLDDVHTPWVPSAEDQQVGRDGRTSVKGDTADRFRRVVTEMDLQVGRLLDALRERKADRPTLVLFLGDNGPLPTFEQQRTSGLRGSKLSLYEGGIRVPCLAWGPGLVPSALTNDTTVFAAVDLFPTLCKLCDADLPERYGSDGEDLSAALVGKVAEADASIVLGVRPQREILRLPQRKESQPECSRSRQQLETTGQRRWDRG